MQQDATGRHSLRAGPQQGESATKGPALLQKRQAFRKFNFLLMTVEVSDDNLG